MRALALAVVLCAAASAARADAPHTLYLNRCAGGCTVHAGADDARTNTSTIPNGGTEFQMTEWAWGDEEWDAFMLCMREVYSPFQIDVTDVRPTDGRGYNEGIVAGRPEEIGIHGAGGIAPITNDCTPLSYAVSFSFANIYGPTDRAYQICWTAAQETGHAYGLDHAYRFLDGSSACNDPMTYRGDCGGEKFFRNQSVECGEFTTRPCRCGNLQNSHLTLLSVLGPATPITSPPTLSVIAPTAGATIANGATVVARAAAQRGVFTVELWLNGTKWAAQAGGPFGPEGQPETTYQLVFPPDVPDGVIDIVVKAKDDLGITTANDPITVTKGAPCADATSCATGQKCDAGKCYWDAPTGVLGDACDYPQFCTEGTTCEPADGEMGMRCTQTCVVGVSDSCPDGYDCLGAASSSGVCWPAAAEEGGGGGGCCSTGGGSGGPITSGLCALALAFALGKRRR